MADLKESTAGASTKPLSRYASREEYLSLVRTVMRILVALEADPVSLEASMSELRVLESRNAS